MWCPQFISWANTQMEILGLFAALQIALFWVNWLFTVLLLSVLSVLLLSVRRHFVIMSFFSFWKGRTLCCTYKTRSCTCTYKILCYSAKPYILHLLCHLHYTGLIWLAYGQLRFCHLHMKFMNKTNTYRWYHWEGGTPLYGLYS